MLLTNYYNLTTKQPHLSAVAQPWHFSLFDHIAQMPDETDAKILTASPLGVLKETTTYYVDEDYPAGPEMQ